MPLEYDAFCIGSRISPPERRNSRLSGVRIRGGERKMVYVHTFGTVRINFPPYLPHALEAQVEQLVGLVFSCTISELHSSTATRFGEIGRTNDLTRKQRQHLLDGVASDDGHEPGSFRYKLAKVFQGRGKTTCRFDAVEPGLYIHRQLMRMGQGS